MIGTPRTGGWPSWIGNDTLVLTSGSAEVWYYRLGMREARKWFADFETGGGVPIPTLLDAEVSPNGTRLAVVRGDNQETVVLYRMNGRPPATPSPFTANCHLNAERGRLSDPTWSTDGKRLALQDGNHIYVVSLPSLAECRRARVLRVIRGGSQPDFGRAPVRARVMALRVCCAAKTTPNAPTVTFAYGISQSGRSFAWWTIEPRSRRRVPCERVLGRECDIGLSEEGPRGQALSLVARRHRQGCSHAGGTNPGSKPRLAGKSAAVGFTPVSTHLSRAVTAATCCSGLRKQCPTPTV